MKDVFTYTDFRLFIQDTIKFRKSQDPAFTHRRLCAHLGLHTSNFVLLVAQGKKNLPMELAQKLGILLGLRGVESDYFLWMVLFGQATTGLEKDNYWRQMLSFRSQSQTTRVDDSQYEYYSHWYNPVIRELVAMPHVKWDTQLLARAIRPRIPATQVRHSLDMLAELGLIRAEGDSWGKEAPFVGTAPEVHSVAVFNYHRELLDLAKLSLETDSGQVRNFSALTLELNEEEYGVVVDMLTALRRDALGVCGSTGPSDRVYQMNLHLFPVTKVLDRADEVGEPEE